MNKHPQRYVLPVVVPAGFDDPYRLVLDVPKNWQVYFPEITEAVYAVGGAEGQEVQIRHRLEIPLHVRDDHVPE